MLVGFGIVLIIAGAILTFAVDAAVENVDLAMVGWILIAGGVLSLVAGAIRSASWMSLGKKKYQTERHVSPDGQHYVEETRSN